MHANLRDSFSINPERNKEIDPWQHLRTDQKSLTLFGLYGKMIFENIEIKNNVAEIKELSLFANEFKKGLQSFGITDVTTEIDMFFDTVDPNNPDSDSIEQPVYYFKVTFSGKGGENTILNQKVALKKEPSILNCTEPLYVEKYQEQVLTLLKDYPDKMYLGYTFYVDFVYIDSPEEAEDNKINILEFVNSSETFESTATVQGARVDPSKGLLYTVKCRPAYVSLLY